MLGWLVTAVPVSSHWIRFDQGDLHKSADLRSQDMVLIVGLVRKFHVAQRAMERAELTMADHVCRWTDGRCTKRVLEWMQDDLRPDDLITCGWLPVGTVLSYLQSFKTIIAIISQINSSVHIYKSSLIIFNCVVH